MRRWTRSTGWPSALAALAVAGSAGASRHAGTFKYCTDPTFPPMELATASGKITGFDVDMAQALALTWGANATPVKTAFPGLIPALNAKRCDAVISGIFITSGSPQAGGRRRLHGDRTASSSSRPATRSRSRSERPEGPERRGPGGDEVRAVPEDAEGEDRLLSAELPGRQRRGRAGAARPRRRRPDPGHVVRVPGGAHPGKIASATRSVRRTPSASTTARPITVGAQVKYGMEH